MQLLEVLNNIDYELISGDLNKEITSVEYDSRNPYRPSPALPGL